MFLLGMILIMSSSQESLIPVTLDEETPVNETLPSSQSSSSYCPGSPPSSKISHRLTDLSRNDAREEEIDVEYSIFEG
jgi:hypothetical protein